MINPAAIAALHVDGVQRALALEQLEQWGRGLGAALGRPAVIALSGDLGAGKTTLARAICAGIGVHDASTVTSPTYAILQQYDAPNGPVIHADLYRLRSDRELETLGWDELVVTAPVLLVEWPERAMESLPIGTCIIVLAHDSENSTRRLIRASIKT